MFETGSNVLDYVFGAAGPRSELRLDEVALVIYPGTLFS